MRRLKPTRPILLAAALLLASCATTGAAAGAGGATFVAHTPKVNDVDTSTETVVMHMRSVVSHEGKTVQTSTISTTEKKRVTTTTLAVDNGAATAMRVHFIEDTNTEGSDGKVGAPKESPLSGKTYLAKLVGGKVVITAENGTPVATVAETKGVRDEVSQVGKPDRLPAFLATQKFEKGVAVRVPDSLVRDLFNMAPKDRVGPDGMQLVLKEMRTVKGRRLAVFSTTFTLTGPTGPGATITTHMKGTLTVDTNGGHVVSTNLSGTLEMKGSLHNGPAVLDLSATGTVTVTGTDEYR